MQKTRVVNIRKEKCDIYIGQRSRWGNPFLIGVDGDRDEVIRRYETYVRANAGLLANLEELRGKRLGCFCKPLACHGDILLKLLKERRPQ